MKVKFECVVCGLTKTASVDASAVESGDRPLETLRDCPACEMETIWIEGSVRRT